MLLYIYTGLEIALGAITQMLGTNISVSWKHIDINSRQCKVHKDISMNNHSNKSIKNKEEIVSFPTSNAVEFSF